MTRAAQRYELVSTAKSNAMPATPHSRELTSPVAAALSSTMPTSTGTMASATWQDDSSATETTVRRRCWRGTPPSTLRPVAGAPAGPE